MTEQNSKTRILIVDDDKNNVDLMSEVLEKQGYKISQAYNGAEAMHIIKAWNPHLILLDVNMPEMDGLATIKHIRTLPNHEYIAVIFVSANMSSEDVVRGLDGGADDYLTKPFRMDELLARVRAKLRIKELHDQLKRTTKRLEELVDTDDLTGLFNMRSFFKRTDQELLRAKRYSKTTSCIMMDMDFFKNVNDQNDHLFGSWVLCQVADVIKKNVRATDIAARYGGDEYVILLPETDLAGTERLSERMRQSIQQTVFSQGKHKAKVTCSFGIAACSSKITIDGKEFIRIADQMLYEAKNAGRNCIKTKIIS